LQVNKLEPRGKVRYNKLSFSKMVKMEKGPITSIVVLKSRYFLYSIYRVLIDNVCYRRIINLKYDFSRRKILKIGEILYLVKFITYFLSSIRLRHVSLGCFLSYFSVSAGELMKASAIN